MIESSKIYSNPHNFSSQENSSHPNSVQLLNNYLIEELNNIISAHEQLRKEMDWLKNIEEQLDQSQQQRTHHNLYQQKYFKLLRENNTQEKQKYELGKQNEKYKRQILFLENQVATLKEISLKNIKSGDILQNKNLENKSRKKIKNLLQEEIIHLSQQIFNNELEYEKKIVQRDKELLFFKESARKNFQAQLNKIKKQNEIIFMQNRQAKFQPHQKCDGTQMPSKVNSLQQKEKNIRQRLKELKQEKLQQLSKDISGLRIKLNNKKKDQKSRETQEEIKVLELKIQNECLRISEKTLLDKINYFEQEIKQLQKLEGESIQINKELINRLRNTSEGQQEEKIKRANFNHRDDTALLQQKLQQKLEAVKRQWSLKEIKWKQSYGILENKYNIISNKQKQMSKTIESLEDENWKLKVAINDMKQSKKKEKEKQQKVLTEIKYESFSNSEQEIVHLKDRLKIAQNELIDQKAYINALKSDNNMMVQKINDLEKAEKVEKRKYQQLSKENSRLKLQLDDIKLQIIRIRKYYAYTKQQYEELLSKFQQLNAEKLRKKNDKNKQKQVSFNMSNEPNEQQRKQKIKPEEVDQDQGLSIIYETSEGQRLHSKQSEDLINEKINEQSWKREEKIEYISVITHQQDIQKTTLHSPTQNPFSPFQNQYLPSDPNQRNNSQKSYSNPNSYSAINFPPEQPYFVSSVIYKSNETKKTYLLPPTMNSPAIIRSPLKDGRYFGNQSPQGYKIINNNEQRFPYSPHILNANTSVKRYPNIVNNGGDSKPRYVAGNPVRNDNGYFVPYKQ